MPLPDQKIDFWVARDFGQVLNVSFRFIKLNFKDLLKNLLIIVGPFALLGNLLQGVLVATIRDGGSYGMIVIFDALSYFMAAVILVGVVSHYLIMFSEGEEIETTTIWRSSRSDIWKVIGNLMGSGFLSGVILFIFSLVFVGFSAALGSLLASMGSFFSVIAGLIWFATYYGVLVSFNTVFSITLFTSVYERKGFFEAFGRFWVIVKDKWWQSFSLQFISTMIQLSLFALIFIPVIFFNLITDLVLTKVTSELSTVVSTILFSIIFVMLAVFSFTINIITAGFQYFSLVESKEHVGLLMQIDKIGEISIEEAPEEHEDDDEFY